MRTKIFGLTVMLLVQLLALNELAKHRTLIERPIKTQSCACVERAVDAPDMTLPPSHVLRLDPGAFNTTDVHRVVHDRDSGP